MNTKHLARLVTITKNDSVFPVRTRALYGSVPWRQRLQTSIEMQKASRSYCGITARYSHSIHSLQAEDAKELLTGICCRLGRWLAGGMATWISC